jgi:hypothetical protein
MGGIMVLQMGSAIEVEDLRNHPQEAVESLKKLLAGGAKLNADPKRLGFYEVESGSLVYYIYAPPSTEKIILLATWPNESTLTACCA